MPAFTMSLSTTRSRTPIVTYVLIHGAGSDDWYWHRVTPLLEARGHTVIAPNLPCDDDSAGLAEYTETVLRAIGRHRNLIIVAQSMGGFTAPLVCARVPVELLVLLAAMIPLPGERPGDWWKNTRHSTDGPFDVKTTFFHDVPPEVTAEAFTRGAKDQSDTPFQKPWPLPAWPRVPTRFLLCRQDRFFPAAFMRRVVRERLGITPDEIDGGHLVALSRPADLVERLEAYRARL